MSLKMQSQVVNIPHTFDLELADGVAEDIALRGLARSAVAWETAQYPEIAGTHLHLAIIQET